jgi:hypothetical protein
MDVGWGVLQDTTKRAHTVDLENAAGERVAVFCIIKPVCGPCRTSLDSFVSRVSPPPHRSILITYFFTLCLIKLKTPLHYIMPPPLSINVHWHQFQIIS